MDASRLLAVLTEHLEEFTHANQDAAADVSQALQRYAMDSESGDVLAWWCKQDVITRMMFQSYLGWLMHGSSISMAEFEELYAAVDPPKRTFITLPIQLTSGIENYLYESEILDRGFALAGYEFHRSGDLLTIRFERLEETQDHIFQIDLLLSFLSFLVTMSGYDPVGFRILRERLTSSSNSDVLHMSLSATTSTFPELNVPSIENAFQFIDRDPNNIGNAHLVGLLRIRHRAILDTTLESKLVTLWGFLELTWVAEEEGDKLLSSSERRKLVKLLSFLDQSRRNIIVQVVCNLKATTRNDKIAQAMSTLKCMAGQDASVLTREMAAMRGRVAHGEALKESELSSAYRHYGTMLAILNELIIDELDRVGVSMS